MHFKAWKFIYRDVLKDFGFSEREDARAAQILNQLLPARSKVISIREALKRKTKSKRVHIFGAGPTLEKIANFPAGLRISCNGATSYLLEKSIVPDVIVTDLDGKIEDLILANESGSIAVIHAHGDNIAALKKFVPKFKTAIGTTQGKPFGKLSNFGGFTDGDRAVFLAEHLGAREAVLYGMDFQGAVGRFSFSDDTQTKRKKLAWAERLISYLAENCRINIRYV